MNLFNLTLYPIHIRENKYEKSLPGLVALIPPKKCARGRDSDLIVGLINLTGQTSITPESLNDWMQKKCSLYYKIPGTITNAMRVVADSINSDLLDRNLHKAKDGSQVNGSLNLMVIKRNTSYHLVVGQAHTFLIREAEASDLEDRDNHPRGLGMNQSMSYRFSQVELTEKDSILFAPVPNKSWSVEGFRGGGSLSLDSLTRRLFDQASTNVLGVLIRLSPGTGLVNFQLLRNPASTSEPVQTTNPPVKEETKPEPKQTVTVPIPKQEKPILEGSSGISSEVIRDVEPVIEEEVPTQSAKMQEIENPDPEIIHPVTVEETPARSVEEIEKEKPEKTIQRSELKARVGETVRKVDGMQSNMKKGFAAFLSRILPTSDGSQSKIPGSVLLLISLIVPIIVVAVAGSVYITRGKSQQFELNFLQGQQYAIEAENLKKDPPSYLASLQQAIFYLDKAAEFGESTEFVALRTRVQNELDRLQGVMRISLVSLSDGGYLGDVTISRIVAVGNDVYLLDSKSGKALRYYLSGSGYIQDAMFDCGPNPANPLSNLSGLVDIIPLPAGNSFKATIFGIDKAGNIEYCIPGESGVVTMLLPPDAGWRGIKAITLFQNTLHVLDPEMNAVYRYKGNGVRFEGKPTLYFDNTIPNLNLAIDIEVNGDELYILRSNGEMVECTYSHMKDYKLTECSDPAYYSDMRSGQDPKTVSFPEAQFIQMHMTAAPDSSIYILDATGQKIFHFSLQRNLQKILHPGFPDGGITRSNVPTALTVSSGKIVFVAFGSQVYYGPLP